MIPADPITTVSVRDRERGKRGGERVRQRGNEFQQNKSDEFSFQLCE